MKHFLIHKTIKSDIDICEVVYLEDETRKVVSPMVSIIVPLGKERVASYKAERILRTARSELNTYGVEACVEYLGYESTHQKQLRQS